MFVQLFNNGLKCMTEFVQDLSSSGNTASEKFRRIADLLRVLLHVAQPFQDISTSMPDVESSIQEEFFVSLHKRLQQVEPLTASDTGPGYGLAQETVLMLRLIQFGLGFRNVWWSNSREISDNLSFLLFKLALVSTF